MVSLDRLWLRTAGGRDFVLCAANRLPTGAVPESPNEVLWRLREAKRYGGLLGVRDFLVRLNLTFTFPPGEVESESLLERMIESQQVVGYFEDDREADSGTWAGGLGMGDLPAVAFPEVADMLGDLLAKAAELPGGRENRPPAPVPRIKTSPTTQSSDHAPEVPGDAPAPPSTPSALVAVANQFLGNKPSDQAQKSSPPTTPDEVPAADAANTPPATGDLGLDEDPLSNDQPPIQAVPVALATNAFVLKVVDEFGDEIPDIEIRFGKETMISAPSGATTYTGPEQSVPISFPDPAQVAEALALHHQKAPATRSNKSLEPSADTVVAVCRPSAMETPDASPFCPFAMDAGQTKTVSLRQGKKRVSYVGILHTLFRTDSAVVNPEGEAPAGNTGEHQSLTTVGLIATVLRHNEQNPNKTLLVAGHTDRADTDAHNQVLSEHRAAAVLALVEGERDDYIAACKAKHSELDVTQLFDWVHNNPSLKFTCKPTTLTAAPSDTNYVLFRQSFNAWLKKGNPGVPIKEQGRLTDEIWGAMFDLYEANLRSELGQDPAGLRSKLDWVDSTKKSIGFGERHPSDPNAPDGRANQSDRRVEVLLFDDGEAPDLAANNGEDIYVGGTYQKAPIPAMASARCERSDIRIFLYDQEGKLSGNAPYRLEIAGEVREGTTGADGALFEPLAISNRVARIDWTPSHLLEDGARPTYYAEMAEVSLNATDADADPQRVDRQLRNLGYLSDDREQNRALFAQEFGASHPDTDDGIHQAHRTGAPKQRRLPFTA